jgi:hypothetical protein
MHELVKTVMVRGISSLVVALSLLFYATTNQRWGFLESLLNYITDLKSGLQFKETMDEGFSLDTDEPKQGSSIGKHKGFELAMHAQVDIDKSVAE